MKRIRKVLVVPVILFLGMFLAYPLLAEPHRTKKPLKDEVIQKTRKLQIPFVANEGQTDERVAFYANTFGGECFRDKRR